MDSIDRILRHIPFFRHCNEKELGILKSLGKNVYIPGGQTFDLSLLGLMVAAMDARSQGERFLRAPARALGCDGETPRSVRWSPLDDQRHVPRDRAELAL